MSKIHLFWMISLGIFASPVGIILILKFCPQYWPAPVAAMLLAFCGAAISDDENS